MSTSQMTPNQAFTLLHLVNEPTVVVYGTRRTYAEVDARIDFVFRTLRKSDRGDGFFPERVNELNKLLRVLDDIYDAHAAWADAVAEAESVFDQGWGGPVHA